MPTLTITNVPDAQPAQSTQRIEWRVSLSGLPGGVTSTEDISVDGDARLESEGRIAKFSDVGTKGELLSFSTRYRFPEEGRYNLSITATVDPESASAEEVSDTQTIDIAPADEPFSIDEGEQFDRGFGVEDTSPSSGGYKTVFEDRDETRFVDIEQDEETINVPTSIDFSPYGNPDISVDTSARYATHEIIGGITVRQKIGDDPVQIGVKGVCTESVARDIDRLRNARFLTLSSDRILMRCHVASTSTSPLESGGAVDMNGNELLYEYTINLVGIEQLTEASSE